MSSLLKLNSLSTFGSRYSREILVLDFLSNPSVFILYILSRRIGLILLSSLYENINVALDRSKSIPEKYLSWNSLFWDESVK